MEPKFRMLHDKIVDCKKDGTVTLKIDFKPSRSSGLVASFQHIPNTNMVHVQISEIENIVYAFAND